MTNYGTTIIYCLEIADDRYIGSTVNKNHRKGVHETRCSKDTSYVYQFIRANGGWDKVDFIVLEHYPCSSKKEKINREQTWTKWMMGTLNCNNVTCYSGQISKLMWKVNHREQIRESSKIYTVAHREQIKQHKNEKIKCNNCNSIISRANISRHKTSDKCLNFS